MRVLVDENVSRGVAEALRASGHEVEHVADTARSASDRQVPSLAIKADAVLVTFDADFGRMIFAERRPSPRAVIYLRSPPPSPAEAVRRILRVLAADAPAIDGQFVSIDTTSRYHPLPNLDGPDA